MAFIVGASTRLGLQPGRGLARQGPGPSRRQWRMCAVQPARNVTRFTEEKDITETVEKLYDAYPFPPDPLIDEEPIGYNWRWHYPTAYSFCARRAPATERVRILDAGCGTGCGTEYLVHLNPQAEVVGFDLSAEALRVAEERLKRSVGDSNFERTTLIQKSIFDAEEIEGEFDLINCVGVIHHTPDPLRALRALATKLKPGGILHIFVYALHGRWEIQLMQRALAIMQKGKVDFKEGVALGRRMFNALPEDNRLRVREQKRWAQENQRDATFADMYLHPQEIDYTVESLFETIDASGLEFVGFSNPRTFDLQRIFGRDEELVKQAETLSERERYRLVELLDPESVTHFEFFLTKPPFEKTDWSSDEVLRGGTAVRSPCIHGYPGALIFDRDYHPVNLSPGQASFLEKLEEDSNIGSAMERSGASADEVRPLVDLTVIIPTPKA